MTTPTYDEWVEGRGAAATERTRQHQPQLEMLRQAAVKAELLTGIEQWDTFLSYLQAAVEQTEQQIAALSERITDPSVVDHDTILKAKLSLAECNGRLDAWKATLALPKEIIAMGKEAMALLDGMK